MSSSCCTMGILTVSPWQYGFVDHASLLAFKAAASIFDFRSQSSVTSKDLNKFVLNILFSCWFSGWIRTSCRTTLDHGPYVWHPDLQCPIRLSGIYQDSGRLSWSSKGRIISDAKRFIQTKETEYFHLFLNTSRFGEKNACTSGNFICESYQLYELQERRRLQKWTREKHVWTVVIWHNPEAKPFDVGQAVWSLLSMRVEMFPVPDKHSD